MKWGYGGEWLARMTTAFGMARELDEEDGFVWTNISKKRQTKIREAIRSELEEELKEQLIKELTPVIHDQARQEIEDEALKSATAKVRKEMEEARPTNREREAFQHFVRDIELDAHAQAVVASNRASEANKGARWARRWRTFRSLFLAALIGPALFAFYRFFQVHWDHLGIVAAVMLVPLLVSLVAGRKSLEHLEKVDRTGRETASNYLRVADQAKAYRLMHAERLDSKKELDKLIKDLGDRKDHLDSNHHLRVEDLYAAKDTIRGRIEMDEPKFRVFDDFDERLEEAQAESESAESVKASS